MSLKDLTEKRNKLSTDMQALHEKSETEDRAFTPEERESWDAMVADVDALDSRIEVAQRAADYSSPVELPPTAAPAGETHKREATPTEVTEQRQTETKDAYADAFDSYMRRGITDLSDDHRRAMFEKRALGGGTDAGGGYTVPTDMANSIIELMAQYGGIINVCNVLNTSAGNPIDFPTNDDTGNPGQILAENSQVSETDPVFGTKQLAAYKYTSDLVRVSIELLQDNGVNLDQYLVNILAKRLGRAESQHIATGSGTDQPEGLATGATLTATAAGATAITYADILDVEHAVDPAYRSNGTGTFVMHDSTLKAMKGLVDSEGRPLWLPGIAGSAPGTILGHRYQVDQGIEAIGTGNRSVVFGDMSGFTVRRTMGVDMLRLSERYADFYQVGFVAFTRVDSALLDVGSVAALVHP